MVLFDLVNKNKHFFFVSTIFNSKIFFIIKDECDQETECYCCTNKFHNDNNHQYILSNSHRLIAKKRLDLIALMQNDILLSTPIHHSPPLSRNQSNTYVSVSCRKFNKKKRKKERLIVAF